MLSLPSAGSSLRSGCTDELQGTQVGLLCPKWNCSGSKRSWITSLIKTQFILFIKIPLNWNCSSSCEMRQYRGFSPPEWYWEAFIPSAFNSTKSPVLQKPAHLGMYFQRCQQHIPGLASCSHLRVTVAPGTTAGHKELSSHTMQAQLLLQQSQRPHWLQGVLQKLFPGSAPTNHSTLEGSEHPTWKKSSSAPWLQHHWINLHWKDFFPGFVYSGYVFLRSI